jgi:hypothetical protein
MTYRQFLFLVMLFTITSCKEEVSTLKQPIDKERISVEILQMFDAYHAAIKENGLEAEFDFLDNSSDFFWVPPGYKSAQSYDQVKNVLIENNKAIKSIQFKFDTIQVYPLSDSIANYSGIVSGKMLDTSSTVSTFKIIESGTLIKRKNGWKLLNGQSRNLIEF